MPRSRKYARLYDEDDPSTIQVLLGYTKSPYFFTGLIIFALFALFSDASVLLELVLGPQDSQSKISGSPTTPTYPFSQMQNIILHQPVDESDVPLFWHPHKVDGRIIQKALVNCYGVDTIELDSIESIKKARAVNLAARKANNFALTSPFFLEAISLFTLDHMGRGVCFFRHPLDYDFDDNFPHYEQTGNWIVRYLSQSSEDDIGIKELGIAKQIIRDNCVASTMDRLSESIQRAAAYLGWQLKASETCVDDIVEDEVPSQRDVNPDSEEWKAFSRENRYDLEAYEYSQQAWRQQSQTVVPLWLQHKRADQRKKNNEE